MNEKTEYEHLAETDNLANPKARSRARRSLWGVTGPCLRVHFQIKECRLAEMCVDREAPVPCQTESVSGRTQGIWVASPG